MKFSIIVLLYNTPLEKIYFTIDSIIKQKIQDIEIIFADDGSKVNYNLEIQHYCEKYRVTNYYFTPPKSNVGTVKNILDGLKYCTGKYIKLIGAGDALYNQETLNKVHNFMENKQAKICFGGMKQYCIEYEKIHIIGSFRAPKDILAYKKCKCNNNSNRIRRNILKYGDWISGASLFYEKNFLCCYLEEMKDIVMYCEDLITAKAVLDNVKIHYIDCNVIWYEVGSGISTKAKAQSGFKRIYNDQLKFYRYLINHYEEKLLKRGYQILKYSIDNDCSLLKNQIKRMMFFPERIHFSLIITYQKIKKVHEMNAIGFLNES